MRAAAAAGLVALALVLPAGAAASRLRPGSRVSWSVGVSMPVAGLQVGAVRGRDVVLAKGLEIELARAIAKELGVPRVRFVNEALFSDAGQRPPHRLGPGDRERSRSRRSAAAASTSLRPISPSDQVCSCARAGAHRCRPRSPRCETCSSAASARRPGRARFSTRIKPRKKPRLANDPSQLLYDLYNDRCDAVVYDADILGAAARSAPERYGPFAGRIVTARASTGSPFPREASFARASTRHCGS